MTYPDVTEPATTERTLVLVLDVSLNVLVEHRRVSEVKDRHSYFTPCMNECIALFDKLQTFSVCKPILATVRSK